METTQKKGHFKLEALAALPNYYLPKLSHDKNTLAFYWDKSGKLELYVMDLETHQVRQITNGELPRAIRAGFIWDRTDQNIVFTRDFHGNEQHDLYNVKLETNEVSQITNDPKVQELPWDFTPDNQWIVLTSNKEGQPNVWKVRSDGSEEIKLTNYASPVFGCHISPDGEWIAYSVNGDSADLKNVDCFVMSSDGSEKQRVLHIKEGSQEKVWAWHPHEQKLAVSSDASGVDQSGVLDLQTGEVQWLSEPDIEETPLDFSSDGKLLLCRRDQEAQVRPVIYDLETGQRRDLKLPEGVTTECEFMKGDNALVLKMSADNMRNSLLVYNLEIDNYHELLPTEYDAIDPNLFVKSEHIYYPSNDGTLIPALLFKPRNIEPGQKLPALIEPHGGPTYHYTRSFQEQVQYLVDQGYVLLLPNVRGSTGYGVKFRDANLMDLGGGDLDDIEAGANYLKSLPYVDGERLGIFGGSYGGYMTYMALTKKPDLWKCGIATIGITDWLRLYDESMEHFKYYIRTLLGERETSAALWADRSAINFVQNMKAKLLIIHGANDPRCPLSQATAFREKLLEHGFKEGEDFEYVVFEDQGHGSGDISHKIKTYQIEDDFFARNL